MIFKIYSLKPARVTSSSDKNCNSDINVAVSLDTDKLVSAGHISSTKAMTQMDGLTSNLFICQLYKK